ncbi:MAG: hypothetical protein IBJ18_01640 [Phycisphaerales bacterium]|nr:hypothetical protein [Phycisphaerales bacterium]
MPTASTITRTSPTAEPQVDPIVLQPRATPLQPPAFMRLIDTLLHVLTFPSENPAFPHTHAQIEDEERRIRSTFAPLPRPLIIVGGYHAPHAQPVALHQRLLSLLGPEAFAASPNARPLCLSYMMGIDTDQILDALAGQIEAAGLLDPATRDRTVEVDLIGISMGGVLCRALCQPPRRRQRRSLIVHAKRIFTLGSPHNGATLARDINLDPAGLDLLPNSGFLRTLNTSTSVHPDELTCYARLRDFWVGATNAAPPGHPIIWTPGQLAFTHLCLSQDRRILVDLCRRLRGEPPLARASTPPSD